MIASPSAPLVRFVSPRWPGPRQLLIGLVALAVVLGLTWTGHRTLSAPRSSSPPADPFPVLRGPISSSISATGAVAATRQAKLGFRVGGTIEEIAVGVGDTVTAGQPLARLATDALQAKVEQVHSQLAEAQLRLQELLDGATPEDLAAAQVAYDAAAAKLADLEAGPSAADLEAAAAGVAAAQGQYDQASLKLRGIEASGELVSAQAAVASAEAALTSAETKLEQVRGGAAPDELAAARAAADQARGSLRAAEAKLDQLKAGSTRAELAAAQAALDQAQAAVTAARAKLDQVTATQPVPADVAQAQAALAAAIAAISLLVGGIGIMNIMLVSVTERTREIGIRKAVGARRRDILAQFLVEAVVVSLVGGLLGIVLGAGGAGVVAELGLSSILPVPGAEEGIRPSVGPDAVALAFGVSVATGLFFGMYPAVRAARLHPIEALRHE
jgi:hypothetical protein